MLLEVLTNKPGQLEQIFPVDIPTAKVLTILEKNLSNWTRIPGVRMHEYEPETNVVVHGFSLKSKPGGVVSETLTITESERQMRTAKLTIVRLTLPANGRYVKIEPPREINKVASVSLDTSRKQITIYETDSDECITISDTGYFAETSNWSAK